MRRVIASLILVILSCSLWAQHAYSNKQEKATIERVKGLQASSLDPDLPKVTLEFFLKYEGEGAPIKETCLFLQAQPDRPCSAYGLVNPV